MRAPRPNRLGMLLLLAALGIAACASAAPPARVTSMSQIAGKWQGTITRGFNGRQELYYLTIEPDGKMVAQWGPNWQWGKVTLDSSGASFEMSDRSSGPLKYYQSSQGRQITMEPTFGGWYVQVTPVR